jgi:4-amino-4-deoxy-L-arabinose transferase-like glycosyltransferase
LLLLLLCAGLLLAGGLLWGLPNHFDFAQDSVAPLGRLAHISAEAEAVTTYRYPPFHLQLLNILWTPLRVVARRMLEENPKVADTLFILSARLASLVMTLGTVALLFAVGRRLWDRWTGLLAGLLFAFAPATVYYGKNANLDAPYLFWLAAALFFYVRILQERRRWDYAWLGLTAAAAVCTKDQAYAFFVLMPAPLLADLWRPHTGPDAPPPVRARLQRLGLGLGAFVVAFVLIHNILFDPAGFRAHVRMIVGDASAPWREFTAAPAGQLRLLLATLLRLTDAWTLAGVLLAGIGLRVALRDSSDRGKSRMLLVPALSYYVFFPAVIGYVYTRFTLPLILVLSLFAARGVHRLWHEGDNRALRRGLAVGLVAWIGLAGLSVNTVMMHYSRYDAQQYMEARYGAETAIAFVGDMRDMPRFNRPLDPHPLVTDEEADAGLRPREALRRKRPDVIVLSLAQGEATTTPSYRPGSLLRRALAPVAFGRHKPAGGITGFRKELLRGTLPYREAARFESPVSPFVPEVAESLNRTIVILERES